MQMVKLCTVEAAQFHLATIPFAFFFFGPNLKLTQSFYNPKTSLKQPRLMIELIFFWPWDALVTSYDVTTTGGFSHLIMFAKTSIFFQKQQT